MQKLTNKEKLTVEYYEQNADSWHKPTTNLTFQDDEIKFFKKYLSKGNILEIGCGNGHDAKRLINEGYDYTGTDITKSFIQMCQKSLPNSKFFPFSVYDLSFPRGTEFDGFWASAVLLHVPKNKIELALTQINKYIKVNGIGFISLKEGKGEQVQEVEKSRVTDQNKTFSRFFSFYAKEEFTEILTRNGFSVIDFTSSETNNNNWLWFIVQKTSQNTKKTG